MKNQMGRDDIPHYRAKWTEDADRDLHQPLLVLGAPAPYGGTEKRQRQRESGRTTKLIKLRITLFSPSACRVEILEADQCLTSLSRADFFSSSGAPGQ
jgi:hypothetical protein